MVAADTVSFGQVLEHLRSVAKDDGTTNGRLFERLIQSFCGLTSSTVTGSGTCGCGTITQAGTAGLTLAST